MSFLYPCLMPEIPTNSIPQTSLPPSNHIIETARIVAVDSSLKARHEDLMLSQVTDQTANFVPDSNDDDPPDDAPPPSS
ncbi:unnamed protein product, partial [Mesorhabditis spiculigera]